MKTLNLCVLAAATCAASISVAQGPTSTYYLTSANEIFACRGNTCTSLLTTEGSEYGIAVDGDVRTTNVAYPGHGHQYTLDMHATGVTYSGNWQTFLDGACDGSFNYTVTNTGFNNQFQAIVYRFDRNWQDGMRVFLTQPNSFVASGITCDLQGGVWLGVTGSGFQSILHYSMDGMYLGSFSVTPAYGVSALAMDYADGTLWMAGSIDNIHPTLFQYSTSGTPLSHITYAIMGNTRPVGGEFNVAVPEPCTLGALGIGFGLLLRRRRR